MEAEATGDNDADLLTNSLSLSAKRTANRYISVGQIIGAIDRCLPLTPPRSVAAPMSQLINVQMCTGSALPTANICRNNRGGNGNTLQL